MDVSISHWKVDSELDRVFYKVAIKVRGSDVSQLPRSWYVWKSYRQFLDLKQSLGVMVNLKFESTFPRKYYMRQHMTSEEVEVRKHMLENWLQELCHSEEFVYVSYKIVLAQLNIFFDSVENGGDIVFKYTSAVLDDLTKSSSNTSLFSTTGISGGAETPVDPAGQLQVNDAGAAVVKTSSSYPDIFGLQGTGTGNEDQATKKRHFFHRLLFPLLAPAHNNLALPISIEYLTAHLPCKVDLMSVLNTIEGGFTPESCSNAKTGSKGTAEDETLHQLGKDFSRDRLVVQGVKVSGCHIALEELIELAAIQARQRIFNSAAANSREVETREQFVRQIGLINTDSVDRESSVYEPGEFFGDDIGDVEADGGLLGVDAYVYSARSSSVGSDSNGSSAANYVLLPPAPQRRSPPRGTGGVAKTQTNSTSAPFANSVPRLPNLPGDTSSTLESCPFIDMENQAAISTTCANAGIFDDILRAFIVQVLFTASRTNSAYHANIALQIMLGALQLPNNDEGSGNSPGPGDDGGGEEEEEEESPGELIISPDSALARPIYIEFTWKQLTLPVVGDGTEGDVSLTLSSELVWCLVCDIKCATVYKIVNSNDIEKVLLQCKTTYYKQVVLTANPRSPLNYSQDGANINEGAWLFLDKDVKLTGEHTLVWKSDV